MSSFYNPYLGGDEIFDVESFGGDIGSTGAPINQAIQNLWERTGSGILAYGKSTTQFSGLDMDMQTTFGSDDASKYFEQKSDKMSSILSGLEADSNVTGSESEVRAAVNRRIQTRRKAIRQADAVSSYNVRTGNVYGDYRDPMTGKRRSIYDQYSDEEISDFTEDRRAQFASFDELLPELRDSAYRNLYNTEESIADSQARVDAQVLEAFGTREEFERFAGLQDAAREQEVQRMIMERDGDTATARAQAYNDAMSLSNLLNEGSYSGGRLEIYDNGLVRDSEAFTNGGELERYILASLADESSLLQQQNNYDAPSLLRQFGEFYEEQRAGASEVSAASIKAEFEQRRADLMKAQQNMEQQERESAAKLREGQEEAEAFSRELKAENQRDLDALNRLALEGPDIPLRKRKVRGIDMGAGRPE